MSTVKQGTVVVLNSERTLGTVSGMSKSDSRTLSSIFSGSPITGDDKTLTDDEIKKLYKEVLSQEINDGGHTFGTITHNYSGAPNLEDVATGGKGLPATPHVPNPVSPGVGSFSATDQAEAPDGFGTVPNENFGSGQGHALNPSQSSAKVKEKDFDQLDMGKSTD